VRHQLGSSEERIREFDKQRDLGLEQEWELAGLRGQSRGNVFVAHNAFPPLVKGGWGGGPQALASGVYLPSVHSPFAGNWAAAQRLPFPPL
jgi:hypothetical protein